MDTAQENKTPTIDAQIFAAKRRSTSIDLLEELEKKFSLKNLPHVEDNGETFEFMPLPIVENFLHTQATLMTTLLYLGIDLEDRSYFIMDLRLGERYEAKKKGKKK